MKITRSHINFLLEGVSLAAFSTLAGTGFLMKFRLPPGSGESLAVLGLVRHDWGAIHLWLAFAFLALMLAHILLHWRWIKAMAQGRSSKGRTRRLVVFGVTTTLFLIIMILPWLLRVELTERTGEGRGHRRGHAVIR